MTNWQPLKQGDIVDIIAPAHGVGNDDIAAVHKYIKSIGLTPRTPDDLIGEDLFHSNSYKIRLNHLKNTLSAEDSKAIWCIRGGYGTANLLHELSKLQKPTQTKLVIGFSDITALHLFVNQKWGWASLHGAVLWQVANDKISEQSKIDLEDVIFGRSSQQVFELTKMNNCPSDNIDFSITGGNLTIIQNSIGTSWQIAPKGKILLLEEVDEEPYKVDRSLNHLKQAGIFDDASAVIFGDFTASKEHLFADKLYSQKIEQLLKNFAHIADIPVFRIENIGHGDINHPIALNAKATLHRNTLTVDNRSE